MSIIQIQKVIKLHWRKIGAGLLGFLFIASTAYYGWQVYGIDGNSPVQLIVYAFSTQEEVFTQGIFPAFEQSWESTADTDLIIKGVFGPSGTLAGQINLGAPADVAIFSNENHINWLKIGHLIEDDVQPLFFGTSPVVIVTRPGNPAGIEDFSDLSQPDLILLHADPSSSGAGEWSLIAVYGSIYLETEDESTSLKQLQEIWHNVNLMAPSARATLTLFELGAGDALITYEQDAMLAQDRGVALDVVIPSPTILTQPAAVAINKNITRSERDAAQAFLDFLSSAQGQTIFAHYHLRPASPEGPGQFPQINAFTTKDLGGWAIVYSQLLKPYWEKEILPALSLDAEFQFLIGNKEMQKTSDPDLNNNQPQTPPNPIPLSGVEGSLSIPESHTLVEIKKAWWSRVRIDKIGLFIISIYLFILAIMLLKDGARVLTPLIQGTFQVTNTANSLGFGWLFAYIIMSGSPVAAAALAFFDSGVVSKLGAFAMITGSRLGASFIVLLIGFLYVLRGRNRATSLSMGLLSLSITGSTYIPAFFLGIFLLQTGQLDRIQFNRGALLHSTTDLLVGPITDFISGVFPQWVVFFIGLGIIYFSFSLFDKCLPQMAIKESQVGWASRLVYRPVVMFLFGALITLISMSVSVSLSILVPLSNRGFIRRENVLPYIMGANITTFIDTLLAAVLLGNPPAFTIVFVEMLTITLVSMIILIFFYPRYQRMILNFVAWVTENNRNLAVFLFIIFLIPILLVLI